MSRYKGRIDRYVREAALALGPKVTSYDIQDFIKRRWPYYTPKPSTIAQILSSRGYARTTGRLVIVDPRRSRTAAEYEIIEKVAR